MILDKNSSDKELISIAITDEFNKQKVFEIIVNRYKNYISQICYSKLKNTEDAEDATQEVFVRAYFALEKFRFDSEFKTWLTQIAINVCITILLSKKRKFWKSFVTTDGDVDIDIIYRATLTQTQENNFWETIGLTLNRMIHGYRKVFILKYFKNLNVDLISKKIIATIGATKMKLKRAKDQFIKILLDE